MCIIPSKLLRYQKGQVNWICPFQQCSSRQNVRTPASKHHIQTRSLLPALPRFSRPHDAGILKHVCLRGSYCFDRAMTKKQHWEEGTYFSHTFTSHSITGRKDSPKLSTGIEAKAIEEYHLLSLLCLPFHTI